MFASWKHLGGAKKDRFWKSHTAKENAMFRSEGAGWSYMRYELGGSGSGLQLCNYVPQVRSAYGAWDLPTEPKGPPVFPIEHKGPSVSPAKPPEGPI